MKQALNRVFLWTWPVTAVLIAFVLALPALAQEAEPQLADLQIAVWPEYDQPAVLVIYDGTLDAAMSLPRQLRLPIPAGASVNAVAYRSDTGRLMTLPWEVESTDAGDVVVFETEAPDFVVEYYADVIAPPPQRSFDLDLGLPGAASQVTLTVRQPAGARDMRIDPALPAAGLDELGNPRFSMDLGARAAGDVIPLEVDYAKADDVPSLAATTPAATAAQPTPALPDDAGLPDGVAVAAGVALGLAVAAGAVYLINRSRHAGPDTRQARRRQARAAGHSPAAREPRPAPAGGGQDQFCRQCGQQFTSGDRFCRTCGAARQ